MGKRNILIASVSAIAGALLVGATFLATSASAVESTASGDDASRRQQFCAGEFDRGDVRGRVGGRDGIADTIAEKLDIDAEDLAEVAREVLHDRITDRLGIAVENGRISEERADEVRSALETGTLRETVRERVGERRSDRDGRELTVLAGKIRDRMCD